MPASPNTCTRQDGPRRSGGVCFAALTVESVLVPEVSEGPDSRESSLHQPQPRSRPGCLVVSGCGYSLSSEICTSLHSSVSDSVSVPSASPPYHRHGNYPCARFPTGGAATIRSFMHAFFPLLRSTEYTRSRFSIHPSIPSLITRFPDQLFLRLVSTFSDPSHPDPPCLPSQQCPSCGPFLGGFIIDSNQGGGPH